MRSPTAPRPGISLDCEASLSAILFQLDAFNELSCTLGIEAARRLLGQVPARCSELLPTDTTLRGQQPGTFLVLGLLNEAEATVLAERLKVQFLQRPFAVEAKMLTLTASFGVATRDDIQETREQWLTRVHGALQAAKLRGGNRVEVATLRRRDLPITSSAPEDSQQESVLARHQGLKTARTPTSLLPADARVVFDPGAVEQLRELADDPSFLEELCNSYLASAQQAMADLRKSDDAEAQRRAVQLLKGSSLNVGASAVAIACRELEHELRMQADCVDVLAWVEVVEQELDRVRTAWHATFGSPSDS